jgi:LCCL domain
MRDSRAGRRRLLSTLCLFAGAALAVGCGGSNKTTASDTTTTTSTTSSSTATSASSTSGSSTSGSTVATIPATGNVWETDAQPYRGHNGAKYSLNCTAAGTPSSIWGVETYTDDSSICNAAVHVGLITFTEGGEVEIEIAPGQDQYEAGVAHDVTSTRYDKWQGSFTFPAAPPGSGQFAASPKSWERKATEYRGKNGTTVTLACSAGGNAGSVWGTGTYTDDSSICTAAVHAGLITVAAGGAVTIQIAPGKDAYQGTTANGVTSSSYGTFSGSFTFPTSQPSS